MSGDRTPSVSARRAKHVREWVVNIALILAIVGAVQWWKARPLVTGTAPPLVGVTLDGQAFDLAALAGRPVLVHFWASWCPVCGLMDGAVAAIAEDYAVVTVAMQSGGPQELRRYMAETGHAFPVIADPTGQIAHRWGVVGVPATFVVDPSGRIRDAVVGIATQPGLRWRLWRAGPASSESAREPTASKPRPE
ncbi:protein disulfide oxidoreductase [Thiocapsa marina]|uniref:Alkyl hydroperoxide reductase/ Thiol specific antioxidant/ Mal allergen n=1 Tax=Thiocapsa marina 5811 TaxID=768671 RepID=F9UBL5_9GAMM|nr:protein disulfide oxidoreductase [Thiocapsa marina]EGV18333.1 alkyl hydroperoxide reductase/ Thiol specific antioxidant/ Mal allergen [Thiocapsa marina 5811]